ncbi:MAG: ankyrin repeat domain-containing protein [Planctomycetota bacterium]|jgi:ankyrin repeat protein
MDEKKSFIPWKSTLAILIFFGLVMLACLLWTPIRIRHNLTKLQSDDIRAKAKAADALASIGKKGKEAAAEFSNAIFSHDGNREKFVHLCVLLSIGEPGREIFVSAFPEGSNAALLLLETIHINMLEGILNASSGSKMEDIVSVNFPQDINEFEDCNTQLHLAAAMGYPLTAEFMLFVYGEICGFELEDWINEGNYEDASALHIAASGGRKRIARMLIREGADYGIGDSHGYTPLDCAVRENHIGIVEIILAEDSKRRLLRGRYVNALNVAAEHGRVGIAGLIIENGGDHEGEGYLEIPMHVAVIHAQKEFIDFLLNEGASVDAGNVFGETALCIAAENGKKEMAEFLISKGADPDKEGAHGWFPLHNAVARNHFDVVKCLVNKGADVNLTIYSNSTALHIAAEEGYLEIARFLVDAGADVNAADIHGWTALGLAEIFHHTDVSAYLRKLGAKRKIKRE